MSSKSSRFDAVGLATADDIRRWSLMRLKPNHQLPYPEAREDGLFDEHLRPQGLGVLLR